MDFKGQKVFILGGSSGMGLESAKNFSRGGAQVIIAARDEKKLERAAAEIGSGCRTVVLDMTDEECVKKTFELIGAFDHLILIGAGTPAWGPLPQITVQALECAFRTKLLGYFLCAKHAASRISKNGSILFTIGGAARASIPGTAGLAAINGGIAAMARTLARELAPIRVNVLSPGLVDTPAYSWMGETERRAFFENMGGKLPAGRIGTVADIALAVLSITANGFMTGATVDVDGGASLG